MTVDGRHALICLAAAIPPRPGIRTSISTMSGFSSPAAWMAASPDCATPTASSSAQAPTTSRNTARKAAWSSTASTRPRRPLERSKLDISISVVWPAAAGAARWQACDRERVLAGLQARNHRAAFAHQLTCSDDFRAPLPAVQATHRMREIHRQRRSSSARRTAASRRGRRAMPRRRRSLLGRFQDRLGCGDHGDGVLRGRRGGCPASCSVSSPVDAAEVHVPAGRAQPLGVVGQDDEHGRAERGAPRRRSTTTASSEPAGSGRSVSSVRAPANRRLP